MSAKTSLLRGPKLLKAKSRTVTRSMTTGTAICTVPRGARLVGAIISGTASNAGTTATLGIGTTADPATELATANVLAAGVGGGGFIGFDVTAATVLAADTKIYVIYAESGAASNAGAWVLTLLYTEGNDIANDDE